MASINIRYIFWIKVNKPFIRGHPSFTSTSNRFLRWFENKGSMLHQYSLVFKGSIILNIHWPYCSLGLKCYAVFSNAVNWSTFVLFLSFQVLCNTVYTTCVFWFSLMSWTDAMYVQASVLFILHVQSNINIVGLILFIGLVWSCNWN